MSFRRLPARPLSAEGRLEGTPPTVVCSRLSRQKRTTFPSPARTEREKVRGESRPLRRIWPLKRELDMFSRPADRSAKEAVSRGASRTFFRKASPRAWASSWLRAGKTGRTPPPSTEGTAVEPFS